MASVNAVSSILKYTAAMSIVSLLLYTFALMVIWRASDKIK